MWIKYKDGSYKLVFLSWSWKVKDGEYHFYRMNGDLIGSVSIDEVEYITLEQPKEKFGLFPGGDITAQWVKLGR